jgi:hypothetical protein
VEPEDGTGVCDDGVATLEDDVVVLSGGIPVKGTDGVGKLVGGTLVDVWEGAMLGIMLGGFTLDRFTETA